MSGLGQCLAASYEWTAPLADRMQVTKHGNMFADSALSGPA